MSDFTIYITCNCLLVDIYKHESARKYEIKSSGVFIDLAAVIA